MPSQRAKPKTNQPTTNQRAKSSTTKSPPTKKLNVHTSPPTNRGIQRLVWVDPNTVDDNPKNWRLHPQRQLKALNASLDENGWAGAAVYNERTGKLIDGHARKKQAIERNELLPVMVGSWTEEEEARLLLTLDPMSAMAETDTTLLRKLTDEVSGTLQELDDDNSATLATVARDLETFASNVDAGQQSSFLPEIIKPAKQRDDEDTLEKTSDQLPGVKDLKTELEYKWELPYDMPGLLPNMLLECPEPIRTWVGDDATKGNRKLDHYLHIVRAGNVHNLPFDRVLFCHYTDDAYLESYWEDIAGTTVKMLNRKGVGCTGMDLSIGHNMPKAYRIFNKYRNNYIMRYWQEAGLPVIPSVSHCSVESDTEFLYIGFPVNAPCLCVQVHSNFDPFKEDGGSVKFENNAPIYRRSLQAIIKTLKPQSLLVYGGPRRDDYIAYAALPKTLHVISVSDWITDRSAFLNERQKASR